VKQELNSTIDNLIFVDGENFKINESIRQETEKYKLLEQRYAALESSVKSGLQVSKLRDEKGDLENKYEDLKR
jgi:BMFP domain-containing protein YqiC